MAEWPNARGTRVHAEAEEVIRGERLITHELRHFEEEFRYVRAFYKQQKVLLEQRWAFNDAWEPVEYSPAKDDQEAWNVIWGRVIPDMLVWLGDNELLVVDFKTGKRFGNEIKHADQLMLYAVAACLIYPQFTRVITELWYLDVNELAQRVFSRKHVLKFLRGFNERGMDFTAPKRHWPARANKYNCKFCPYKTGEIWKGVMDSGDCNRNPE
jgi:hypothetical protein